MDEIAAASSEFAVSPATRPNLLADELLCLLDRVQIILTHSSVHKIMKTSTASKGGTPTSRKKKIP